MPRFLKVLILVFALLGAGGSLARAQGGLPVTLFWHMADDADVYLNGRPLRFYNPPFQVRGDEAPHPAFSARAMVQNGDVFTVGGRRGGSYGFMLIAVNDAGQPVFWTNNTDWRVYFANGRPDWFLPDVGRGSAGHPVTIQPNPWGPQVDLNNRFGNPALSIWSFPNDRFAFLCGVVNLQGGASPEPVMDGGGDVPAETVGLTVAAYPEMVPVPGYPVYYAPGMGANYFFYDGMYWLYRGDRWYGSSWYNGPWGYIQPDRVPVFVLRVPVGYYRQPPTYFGGWQRDAPPRWGEHWGPSWAQRQRGWDQWDRHAVYNPAPLPVYQRAYAGGRYPSRDQQVVLHTQNYHYQPTNAVVKEHFQQWQQPAAAGKGMQGPGASRVVTTPFQKGMAPGAAQPQGLGAPSAGHQVAPLRQPYQQPGGHQVMPVGQQKAQRPAAPQTKPAPTQKNPPAKPAKKEEVAPR